MTTRSLGTRAVAAVALSMVLGKVGLASTLAPQRGHTGWCSMTMPYVPPTVRLPTDLAMVASHMLRRSPTFRRQCERLASAPYFLVRVSVSIELAFGSLRARTVIGRIDRRPVLANVSISPFGRPEEWIAHEFEHLLEQIEGIDLARLEARRLGVWQTSGGAFESARAIDAGRTVRDELRSSTQTVLSNRVGDVTGMLGVTRAPLELGRGPGHNGP